MLTRHSCGVMLIQNVVAIMKGVCHRLIDWSLTALSTQFRSYHAFKVELYYKYQYLMSINSWGRIIEKDAPDTATPCRQQRRAPRAWTRPAETAKVTKQCSGVVKRQCWMYEPRGSIIHRLQPVQLNTCRAGQGCIATITVHQHEGNDQQLQSQLSLTMQPAYAVDLS